MEEKSYSHAQTKDLSEAERIRETIEGFVNMKDISELIKVYNLPAKIDFWPTSVGESILTVTEEEWDLL